MPPPGACLALVIWFQVSVAFILPTALLLSMQRLRQRHARGMQRMALLAHGGARQAAGVATRGSADRQPHPLAHHAQMDYIGDDEWGIPSVSLFAAQMLWLLLRVALHDTA